LPGGYVSFNFNSQNKAQWYWKNLDIEQLKSKEYDSNSEHPTPEQLFIREAAKHLTAKQKVIWDYHNFDKLTQDEIAIKVGIAQPVVSRHIKAINKKIQKWCEANMSVYEMIKEALERE
jgi:DNA-directed RNA polymerase specialized sigma subunit